MEELLSNYQVATLVAVPSYPNSLTWSEENLVAVASENLITILNPSSLTSARGLITLKQSKPFLLGLVERKALLTPCLQPICLSRDTRPYARSISWSPPGLAPNSGCFLAVCTLDGHVKLYRAPYCEYSSEWIEVVDISDLLFYHIKSINFGEQHDPPMGIREVNASNICSKQHRSNDRFIISFCNKSSRSRKRKGPISSIEDRHADYIEEAALDRLNASRSGILENNEAILDNGNKDSLGQSSNFPHITAEKYAFRSAVLSSLVVAWSPILKYSGTCFSILSVGVKSGTISFWRICEPQYFTINHGDIPLNAKLIGLTQAHSSWITAICFGTSAANSPYSQLILATGSYDGSVKIWSGKVEGLLLSSEVRNDCFSLLAEATTATFIPVSTISLIIPVKSPEHVVLASGSGAGKLEVWIYDKSSKKLHFVGDYKAHEQVVTGLAWAFDGHCLYSCSQDNTMRSWIFHGNALYEAPISSRFPSSNVSCNFSRVSDLCFGLALSPGGLMLAVVRSLDANLLNQMYEKRSQRAVVEFFWTGGQSLKVPSIKNLDNCRFVSFHSSCAPELVSWEANIFQSLLCFEDVNKPVVMWDLVTLLSNLMKEYPDLVENILNKWVSSWFSESSFGSSEEILLLFHDCDNLLTVSSRKLQLLNIICRRVLVSEMKSDLCEDYHPKSGEVTSKERKPDLWKELLMKSERELLERLVAFSFQAVLIRAANLQSEHENHLNWSPVGVTQMERWASINHQTIHNQLKALGSDVSKFLRRKNNGIPEFIEEESCSFCSAPVPFESPEVAWCQGAVNQSGSIERHKLTRCVASMRLCSAIEPVWFCMCCRRQAANLLPRSFFAMPKSPLDLTAESASAAVRERPKPLCPYCGILLQRSMPDFLLSTSPV